jgi:maltooligosyltrehalose trehalohydrolase
LLFQGQEFGSSKPFLFFTDVGDQSMKEGIRQGRFKFLTQFPSIQDEEVQKILPSPDDPEVYARCKLDFSERQTNRASYDLHIDLMKLRREDSRFREQIAGQVDGAVLGPACFVLRYFATDNDDRLLMINLGRNQKLEIAPEPLLAPPLGFAWETLWTSESPRYGGPGAVTVAADDRWLIPAEAAVALRLVPEKAPRRKPKRRV